MGKLNIEYSFIFNSLKKTMEASKRQRVFGSDSVTSALKNYDPDAPTTEQAAAICKAFLERRRYKSGMMPTVVYDFFNTELMQDLRALHEAGDFDGEKGEAKFYALFNNPDSPPEDMAKAMRQAQS